MTLANIGDKLLHRSPKAETAVANHKAELKARPTDPAFSKAARVAIIGAGPAGLTMAFELQKRGYQKVTLLSSLSLVPWCCMPE